jgi:hypothetical protein
MNKQQRHKPEEIILLLREFDSGSLSQESFCQQKQISVVTLNRWRKKFGNEDAGGVCERLVSRREMACSTFFLRFGLRPSLRKHVDI